METKAEFRQWSSAWQHAIEGNGVRQDQIERVSASIIAERKAWGYKT